MMTGKDASRIKPAQDNVNQPLPADALADIEDGKSRNGLGDALGEHKGKLALGVAATLGLMVFYRWREKRLSKENPDEYARLQRMKAGVRIEDETHPRPTNSQDLT